MQDMRTKYDKWLGDIDLCALPPAMLCGLPPAMSLDPDLTFWGQAKQEIRPRNQSAHRMVGAGRGKSVYTPGPGARRVLTRKWEGVLPFSLLAPSFPRRCLPFSLRR